MWPIPFVPIVPVFVAERRRRRSHIDLFPPVRVKWTRYDVKDREIEVPHDDYMELLGSNSRGEAVYRWRQSSDMIATVLREQGWEIDQETFEEVRTRREERPQLLLQDHTREEHHVCRQDEVHIHEQRQQQEIHIHEQPAEEYHIHQQTQNTVHLYQPNRRVDIHTVPFSQGHAAMGQAGPAYPAHKAIEQKKKIGQGKGKSRRQVSSQEEYESGESDRRQKTSKGQSKSKIRRYESEEDGSESDHSARKPSKNRSKGKSRYLAPPSDDGDVYQSESADRRLSRTPKKSKGKHREPSYSESEYVSKSSDESLQPKKPTTAPPNQRLIDNTAYNEVEGFEDDFASASDFDFARSDERDVGEQVRKAWGGGKKGKGMGKRESEIVRRWSNAGSMDEWFLHRGASSESYQL